VRWAKDRHARPDGQRSEQLREALGRVAPAVKRDDQRELRVGLGAAGDDLDVGERLRGSGARPADGDEDGDEDEDEDEDGFGSVGAGHASTVRWPPPVRANRC